jgi:ATP synthase protein I
MTEEMKIEKLPDTHAGAVVRLADAMLRFQVRIVLPVLAVAIAVFTVVFGAAGLLGALVGAVICCASSAFTLWLMRLSAPHGPYAGMAAALGGFAGKMIILLITFMLLGGVTALHPKALAFTMLAGVLVAAGADVVAFRKTKIPTVIPS